MTILGIIFGILACALGGAVVALLVAEAKG